MPKPKFVVNLWCELHTGLCNTLLQSIISVGQLTFIKLQVLQISLKVVMLILEALPKIKFTYMYMEFKVGILQQETWNYTTMLLCNVITQQTWTKSLD